MWARNTIIEPGEKSRVRPVYWVAILVVGAVSVGCRTPSIKPRPHPQAGLGALLSSPVKLVESTQPLSGWNLDSDRDRLRRHIEQDPNPAPRDVLLLAEWTARRARKAEVTSLTAALPWHSEAAVYASFCMAAPSADAWTRAKAVDVHNREVLACLRCAGARLDDESTWAAAMAAAGIEIQPASPRIAELGWDHLAPTADFSIKDINDRAERNGLGIPLILIREFSNREAVPDRLYPRKMRIAATAVMLPVGSLHGGAWRHEPIRLGLYDPLEQDALSLGSAPVRLAYDLTTPIVDQFYEPNLTNLAWAGLLVPESVDGNTGVYLVQPYQRGKIPILFIHGLWSTPQTWMHAYQTVIADPVLRERYQCFVAYYPTGSRVLASTERLRQSLAEIRRTFDPDGTDVAFDQMVLVGHSLGGVVSKTLLQNSGQAVVQAYFTLPFEQVQMSPQTRDRLAQFLFFEPLPYVQRAVLIAAPHRGSRVADRTPGALATRLIRPGGELDEIYEEISMLNGAEVLHPFYRGRAPDTIENLRPESPVLQALANLPIPSYIPYHSIIGVVNPPGQGDLVVPYWSAHLDGAASEVQVPRTHFCTGAPEVLQELRRILRVHAALPENP